jgi:hypothetical protein
MTSTLMFRIFDTVGTAAVVLWIVAHMLCWMVVEAYRLWRATLLKLRRLAKQKAVDE